MLRIKKVSIQGFGPYINETISFNNKSGVTIIWGDNGFGKTTFINALKFCFFGELPKKNTLDQSILDTLNIIQKEQGDYRISVSIDFTIDNDHYSLVRFAQPINILKVPEKYSDFEIDFSLQKNGKLLAKRDGEKHLERVMPINTSRFFIFDGELLEQYNDLSDDSASTFMIKDSIEQILGLPILTNSKREIDSIKSVVNKELIELNKQSNSNNKSYKKIKDLNEKIANLKKDSVPILEDYDKFLNELTKAQNDYNNDPVLRDKLELHSKFSDKEKETNKLIELKQKEIKQLINDSWRGLTYKILSLHQMEADSFIKEFENEKSEYDNYLRNIDHYQVSLNKKICETCEKYLNLDDIKNLQTKIDNMKQDLPKISEEKKSKYLKLVSQQEDLSYFLKNYRPEGTKLESYSRDIREYKLDLVKYKNKKEEIQKEIDNFTEKFDRSFKLGEELKQAKEKFKIVSEAKIKIETQIKELNDKIKDLESAIKKDISDEQLAEHKQKDELLSKFSELLEKGIARFREELKDRVQNDAQKLFLKFANQKDFVGLRINNNYALDIVHQSGALVPVKSSGYSHIVSLCLIGALHKNAPVQGPVFIDSPSGRLDLTHKDNLINILTDLSDQVVLLLYHGELDEDMVRSRLKQSLINEFVLIHKDGNAFETIIKER